jgi:hypothetical protein
MVEAKIIIPDEDLDKGTSDSSYREEKRSVFVRFRRWCAAKLFGWIYVDIVAYWNDKLELQKDVDREKIRQLSNEVTRQKARADTAVIEAEFSAQLIDKITKKVLAEAAAYGAARERVIRSEG